MESILAEHPQWVEIVREFSLNEKELVVFATVRGRTPPSFPDRTVLAYVFNRHFNVEPALERLSTLSVCFFVLFFFAHIPLPFAYGVV
jgi:hypothetical protein